jgi:pregnancy-associated plasma protein-A/type IX secretion system substrate protein
MRKFLLSFVSLFAFVTCLSAQIDRCQFDELLNQHSERFPDLENQLQNLSILNQNTNSTNASQRAGVITIPVVIHILYYEEKENIPDLQVYSQINVLNEDFRLLNENVQNIPAEFLPFAVDTEIEFCLASLDPDGRPSTGINRVRTDYSCIGDYNGVKEDNRSRLFYSALGGTDAWDTEHYLNIWVANTCNQFIGVSTNIAIPGFAPHEDGVIIDYNYFGNNCNSSIAAPYHLGRTATHEIGHFLDLRHPWADCDSLDPDFVADTPRQEDPYFGCPSYPQYSCGSSDMFMNFMNYSDDACMAMFTIGQKERMLATLAGSRLGLTESVGCAFLSQPLPFGPDAILLYPNPATNCIHIDFKASIPGDIDVEMVNSLGQVLYHNIENSRNFRSIDAINLANGVYYISFRAAKQTITKKVLIAK